MPRDKYEKLESITNVVRNIFVVFIAVVLAVILLPQLYSQLSTGKSAISGIETPIFKVRLLNALNTPERTRGTEDSAVPETVAEAAKILKTEGQAWSYVGAYRDGDWGSRYFDVQRPPAQGDKLKALTDVYRRADKPRFINGEWRMGDIEGVVKSGTQITVNEVAIIPGTNRYKLYWVKS